MTLKSRLAPLTFLMIVARLNLTAAAQEFDYDSYESTTLDNLMESTPDIHEGMDVFFKKRQFDAILTSKPKECTALIIGKVLKMQGVADSPPVSHCLTVRSAKGKTVDLFVQDALVDDLNKSVKVGDTFRVFALYLYYSAQSKSLGFLVNGFHEPSPKKARHE